MRCLISSKLLCLAPITLAVTATLTTLSHAQENTDSKYKLAGLATVAYAKGIDVEKGQPISGVTSNSDEYRDVNEFLQLDVDLGDKPSFSSQLISESVKDYEPDFDWLSVNVRWDFHPSADLKSEYLYQKEAPYQAKDSLNGNAFRMTMDIIFQKA